jgi:hypothetical protein
VTRRPRSHVLGDLAVASLTNLFTAIGWTCERIQQDYGEDLIVRVFDDGKATPKYFFVQSKATANIERYRRKDGHIRYRFKPDHITSWLSHRQPVIVTLYDQLTEEFYWQSVHNYFDKIRSSDKTKLTELIFTNARMLDSAGLAHLRTIVEYSYKLADQGQEAARVLMEHLKRQYGLKIEFDIGGFLQLPAGRFIAREGADRSVILFGGLADTAEKLSKRLGVPATEITPEALNFLVQVYEAFSSGRELLVQDSNGDILRRFKSISELMEYIAATQDD